MYQSHSPERRFGGDGKQTYFKLNLRDFSDPLSSNILRYQDHRSGDQEVKGHSTPTIFLWPVNDQRWLRSAKKKIKVFPSLLRTMLHNRQQQTPEKNIHEESRVIIAYKCLHVSKRSLLDGFMFSIPTDIPYFLITSTHRRRIFSHKRIDETIRQRFMPQPSQTNNLK